MIVNPIKLLRFYPVNVSGVLSLVYLYEKVNN